MFKTFIKGLSVLFCGMVGCALFICINTQPAAFASPAHTQDDPTPTATATATYNPGLTLALPTGGTPSGRPGTVIQLTGTGFPPNSGVAFSIATDPNQCTSGNGSVGPLQPQQPATADGNGNFTVQASWPDGANQPNTKYYVCANAANTHAAATTPFTVLGQPTVASSNQTVNAGDKVTITGQNWLPQQGLNVAITAGQGGNTIVSGQTNPDANGTFTLDLTIPAGTASGNYGISVVGQNDPNLKTYQDNAITVNAQATPTPQATATPTPTPQPTPTSTPTSSTNNSSSGGGGGNLTWLIFLLGGVGVVLVIIGLTMYLSNTHSS
ncbi:hypothetical protein [Dictyobacter aurantiacus]|uniref:IPT/TIG domain-containing protein n=1 Tax=Dictyobacter aurantiacus TaxID=1936993 RepID=A0A401ZBB7_9CHLR|nr:hypothetical protein [Dictyobacter aurantiacus]GCE04018.1 hypothetical protein KDAU_13470 [Dictyobacter aurantiacus]